MSRFVLVAALAILGVAAVGVTTASAKKPLHVCGNGCDYATIQAALDAAVQGSTIVVAEGTYAGGMTISTSGVRILGAGAGRTVIDGGGTPGLMVRDGATSVVISGLTLTGGGGYGGGGLNVQPDSEVVLRDSVVTGNSTFREGGGISNGGDLTLRNVTVSHNFGPNGGGIVNGGTLILRDSIVRDNNADYGGGIANAGTAILINSAVEGNVALFFGGGIHTPPYATLTLRDSTVSNNSPDNICSEFSC